MKKIEWCWLYDYSTLAEGLKESLGFSNQKLKKLNLSKEKLHSFCPAKSEVSLPIEVVNDGQISCGYQGRAIPIIYEDDLFLVCSKPEKVHMHPLNYGETNNLLSFLVDENKFSVLKVNKNKWDRGLLYRLDFETSGLVIATKKDEVYKEIRSSFHDYFKEKYYLAWVTGLTPEEQSLKHFLESYEKKGSKMREARSLGFEAQLSYQRMSYNKNENKSLLLVKLNHGLRHQIRVQLSLCGFPIIGDTLYNGATHERLMLHCLNYRLEYGGKKYSFIDKNLMGFIDFLDLDRCLQMIGN
jgi:23S rRNA-/tRNA-specific pseudouridylate synthase